MSSSVLLLCLCLFAPPPPPCVVWMWFVLRLGGLVQLPVCVGGGGQGVDMYMCSSALEVL